MHNLQLEKAVLRLVNRAGYRPLKPQGIAERLKLPKDRLAEVKKTVKRLVDRGQLAYTGNRAVKRTEPADPKSGRLMGVFQRTAKGFGFVRPRGQLPPGAEIKDVYISARGTGDAATGDVVLVQLTKQLARDPNPRGKIIEVIERQTHQFVGTYLESDGSAYVQVDGTLFAQPIHVGDPGAKNARPDDKVVFEMVRFPSPVHDGEGVITEVLGRRGKPGVDTLSIIREFDLPEKFADDTLEEARRQADAFDESIPQPIHGRLGRLDLTAETVLTIDPADARDFDDAISLERIEGGHWRLGIHIADVSHFVRPKSALDREALSRATSVYLPDRVIPMLPEVISNSLASLQPRKVRYTKSAIIEFTAQGEPVATELHSAAIKSDRRLTYEQVDQFLADPLPWRKKLGVKVHDLLGRMHKLAMILRRRRFKRGALELSMPEVKIELDKQGRVSGARVVEHTESHQIIEEFMLSANEAVAELLHARQLPFLRRIHQPPVERKLKALTDFVAELGLKVDNLQNRFELQKLLRRVVGRPEQHAVHFAALRSLQRAVYSPEEEGHYALASDCYCHFTSPIRRYPDLTVHRLIDAMLSRRKPRHGYDQLVVLGEHCSQQERRAESAERELTTLKLLHYLNGRIGQEMDTVVTGVESFGLFVRGIELPAEGLIHIDSLTDDYYRFDRATHTLAGHRSGNTFRLGDMLRVAVARVDLERRELDLRLVTRKKRRAATRRAGKRATKRAKRG